MAYLNEEQDHIVLRIVYAGAPMSGKTASIQALDQILKGSVESQVASPWETQGRTLYFDWLDYTAGVFQGKKIRSQIISVPGQTSLLKRRQLILKNADVIVFVADARKNQFDETQYFFQEMMDWLSESAQLAMPIIIQANKSDLDQLLSPDQLKEKLGDQANISVIATSAETQEGLREVFVMAIGLALEHLKNTLDQGIALSSESLFDDDTSLLAYIETTEENALSPVQSAQKISPKITTQAYFLDSIKADNLCPPIPNDRISSEYIWPGIEGRIILHDIHRQDRHQSHVMDNGSWQVKYPIRWMLLNDIHACYQYKDEAIKGLKGYQDQHEVWKKQLSAHRAYAIVQDHLGFYRIWQIIRRERDMRFIFERIFYGDKLDYMLLDLIKLMQQLRHIYRQYEELHLPQANSLDELGLKRKSALYFGFLGIHSVDYSQMTEKVFIRQCLMKHHTYVSRLGTIDIPTLIRLLRQHALADPEAQEDVDFIAELLI